MPRKARVEFPGAVYHLLDRGDRREAIVRDDLDRSRETAVHFGYDNANRQIWEEQTVAGYPKRLVETARDADGNRDYLHIPGEYLIRYGYNHRNQLLHIYGRSWEPWFNYTYDAAVAEYNADQVWTGNPANRDRRVGYTYTPDMLNRSSVNDNGTLTKYGVNALTQYTALNGATVHYDGNLNIAMRGGWFYYYDAQNRLREVRDWTGALLLQNTYMGWGDV